MSRPTALALKEEGNRRFQEGDYISAEALYSKAIIADPQNPALYTNRAMARLRMSLWDSAMADCRACLALAPDSMKAHYYLAQALLATQPPAPDAALEHARRAHALCAGALDKSLAAVTALALRCKKEAWEARERRRERQARALEDEVVRLMEQGRDEALREREHEDDDDGPGREEVLAEWDDKIAGVRRTFEAAREKQDRRREVPDWAIDDISFGIMLDPVMTKTGKSYERASIVEHLRRSPTDPLTREPLHLSDLRPNLDLKQACDEFLEENGWAVDW